MPSASQGQAGMLLMNATTHAFAATGNSLTVTLDGPLRVFAMQTVCTGGATISIKLQGSINGVDFADLATSTSATGDTQYAVDKPCVYVRASVTITAGVTPTAKVWFAATA